MNDKQRVAIHAANQVEEGMLVGLGTGSTADYFIAELAQRTKQNQLQIKVIASSVVSMIKAKELGLSLLAMEQLIKLDLYVDGADEVAPDNTLLKGQGSDLVREKILARASDQFIVLADQTKRVSYIGENYAIPVEVMPFAWQIVRDQLLKLGVQAMLRKNGNGLAVSAYGSLILDATCDANLSNKELDALLNGMPGVVEHGVFYNLADTVLIAGDGGVQEIKA